MNSDYVDRVVVLQTLVYKEKKVGISKSSFNVTFGSNFGLLCLHWRGLFIELIDLMELNELFLINCKAFSKL